MSCERILIVDDVEANLDVLKRRLERQGYRVFSALNGQRAIEVLQQEPVNLIISDILMPVMDGYDLCRHCQQDEQLRDIPFVFYTATYTDDKDRCLGLNLGAKMFIIKPQPKHELLRLIEQALSHQVSPKAPERPTLPKRSTLKEEEYTAQHGERVGVKLEQKLEQLQRANRLLQKQLSESEQLRKVLAESEQRYRVLAEASAVGVYLVQDDVLQYVNQTFLAITGYDEDEVIGRMSPLDLVTEASRPLMRDQMHKRLAGEPTLPSYSSQCVSKLGAIVDFEVHGAIARHNGRPALIGTLLDITERKQAEMELEKHRDHLDDLVGQRTQELALANERLQELDRLKSMFIASMSHELRTPMNSILGFTGLILDGMTGDINDIQRDQLQRVNNAGRHLLALITDVIDISKVEAGKVLAQPRQFDLSELLAEAVKSTQVDLEQKGLTLKLDIPSPSLSMHTDRQRLLQCVLNLLSNAIKYSKKGHIELRVSHLGKEITIEVEDSGIGMSDDEMKHLFLPFVRLDSELAVKAGGTGLGLYLTRKLMQEVLAGSVSVSSQPGVGSCFTLRLPLQLTDRHDIRQRGEV